jgi:hypothetical protein
MTPREKARRQPELRDPQLAMPFPSRRLLDARRRAEVVALLSRLLLQLGGVRVTREGGNDDTP